jgi:hypothetical protein
LFRLDIPLPMANNFDILFPLDYKYSTLNIDMSIQSQPLELKLKN